VSRPLGSFLIAAALALSFQSEEWPQLMGPRQDGSAIATGVFTDGKSPRLTKLWSHAIEGGYAGLAVVGERVFTIVIQGDDEYAFALDASSGRLLWRSKLDPLVKDMAVPPLSTPAVHGGRVFTLSGACQLRALDAATGAPVWHLDLKARFGSAPWSGCAASPALDSGRVILQAAGREDHRFVALDPASGAVLWSAKGTTRTGRAPAVVAELLGVRQVVGNHVIMEKGPYSGLIGLRAADGAVLWTLNFDKSFSFDPPLVIPGDRVFWQSFNGARMLRVSREGDVMSARELWSTAEFKALVGPAVFHRGHLYGFGGDDLACLDAENGRALWKQRVYAGSLILVDGHLLVLSNSAGLLRVVAASPDGYRERAQLKVFNAGAHAETPPSFAGRRVYLRNEEEIVAVEIGS